MKEVGADLAGEHLSDQVPQCAPTLLTEQNPSRGVNIVTRDDDMAKTFLLTQNLKVANIKSNMVIACHFPPLPQSVFCSPSLLS